jgi:DNA-binding GntR family transcriptional regulator
MMAHRPRRPEFPLRRVTLHEEIVNTLRDMILEGTLVPGSWIAEVKLCNDLGISRTPLREALKVLASENLVRLVQNRGTIVTEVVVEEVVELFEVMEALEELVGRLAADKSTDEDLASLRAMHATMVEHHRAGRRHEYFELNQSIHLRFAELSGNATLTDSYQNFAGRIRRARYLANLSDARWAESVSEHEAFMAALARRDASAFAAMLRDHSRKTGEVVCAALRAINVKPVEKTSPRARKKSFAPHSASNNKSATRQARRTSRHE